MGIANWTYLSTLSGTPVKSSYWWRLGRAVFNANQYVDWIMLGADILCDLQKKRSAQIRKEGVIRILPVACTFLTQVPE